EGHAAVPDGEDVPRLHEVVVDQIGLLDDKVQPAADESGDGTPDEDAPGLVVVDALAPRPAQYEPQGDGDRHHVGDAVPMDRQAAEGDQDWVDVKDNVGQRAEIQPAQRQRLHAILSFRGDARRAVVAAGSWSAYAATSSPLLLWSGAVIVNQLLSITYS